MIIGTLFTVLKPKKIMFYRLISWLCTFRDTVCVMVLLPVEIMCFCVGRQAEQSKFYTGSAMYKRQASITASGFFLRLFVGE